MYNPSTGELVGTWNAADDIIGAGGFMTRGDPRICGSDVSGPYLRRPGEERWRRLFRPGDNYNLTPDGWIGQTGCWEVASAPSDDDVYSWVQYGFLWQTTDGGDTVVKTALPQITPSTVESNDGTYRKVGKMLAYDPVNAAVLVIGTPTGVKITADGGSTWASVSTASLPAPVVAGTRYCIAFDPSSAVVSGKTQGLYAYSPGNGVYRSTNGGTTWTLMSGTSGFTASDMVVGPDGHVHLCGTGEGESISQYRRWNGSSWSAPSGVSGKSLALSPHNPGHLYMASGGSTINFSADNGATWSGYNTISRHGNDIKWHEWTAQGYMANGRILFDTASNRLRLFDGIGAWYVDNPPTNGGNIVWQEASAGIENMIRTLINVSEDGTVLYSCHDRQGFVIPKAQIGNTYPARHALDYNFAHGGEISAVPGNPNFLVIANLWDAGNGVGHSGFSTDRGTTWTPFAQNLPAAIGKAGGGNIIAFSETVFLWQMTSDGPLYWTKDQGNTWEEVEVGVGASTRSHAYYIHSIRVLARDPFNANQALLYLPDELSAGRLGIWRLTYNPGTELLSVANVRDDWIINNTDHNHGQLTPYAENEWLWHAMDGSYGLHHSDDGAATWANVGGIDDEYGESSFPVVFGVAVGKGVTPDSPPAVLVQGFRETAWSTYEGWGCWLSIDGMQTWKRITRFPGNSYDQFNTAGGCPLEFGNYYLGSNQGIMRLKFEDKVDVT